MTVVFEASVRAVMAVGFRVGVIDAARCPYERKDLRLVLRLECVSRNHPYYVQTPLVCSILHTWKLQGKAIVLLGS